MTSLSSSTKLIQGRRSVISGTKSSWVLIFTALTIEELETLEGDHINLREGKIKIAGMNRTNERVLRLEASQVFDLQEYLI